MPLVRETSPRLIGPFALLLLLVPAGCADGTQGAPSGRGATASSTTTLRDVAGVTLTGQVTRSVGNHVVQLGTAPTEPVLVVLREPGLYPTGTRLTATGRISTFVRAEMEEELGVDLGPEVEGLTGERCLVAVEVRLL